MSDAKLFSVAQASKTLPLVRGIVEDILKTGKAIRDLSVETDRPEDHPEINQLMDVLDELFDEIESIGCFYKDWNFTEGLVDFPAKIGGRDVMLCWRSDEDQIRYYHDAEAGYAGRRLIPKELLEERS